MKYGLATLNDVKCRTLVENLATYLGLLVMFWSQCFDHAVIRSFD